MNIMELGALGEFLGSIGVIATLVYLAIQIRQNTHSMNESRRLAVTQAQIDWTAMFNTAMVATSESDYIPAIWLKAEASGVDALTEEERLRLNVNMTAMIARLDMLHLQHQNGFLNDETYEATFEGSVKQFAPMWKSLGANFNLRRRSFRDDVERILAKE